MLVVAALVAGALPAGLGPASPPAAQHAGHVDAVPRSFAVPGPQGEVPAGQTTFVHHRDGRPVPGYTGPLPKAKAYLTGTNALEPTIGVTPNGDVYYAGFNIQGVVNTWSRVLRTSDQGRSWSDVSPGVADTVRVHRTSMDPMLHVDRRTGRVFMTDISSLECSFVSSSDTGGAAWTSSKVCGATDHQNLFTGPPVSSPTAVYPNVAYYCAIDGGALFAYGTMTTCLKSLDGGLTWVRTGAPAFTDDPRMTGGNLGLPGHCGGATGHGVVDDEGTIYLPRGWCRQPYLAISRDEGLTWQRVQVAANGVPFEQGGLEEHEAGVAVDAAGNLYYVWTATDRLPYLAVSKDGGTSWSAPMMIGAPGVREASLPTIDVGSPGRVAIAYVGSTNAPGGPQPTGTGAAYAQATWNGYMTITTTALDADPVFLTTTVNPVSDPLVRGECGIGRCQQLYDFIDVAVAPDGTAYAAMVDGCPASLSTCPDLGLGLVGRVVDGPSLRAPTPPG